MEQILMFAAALGVAFLAGALLQRGNKEDKKPAGRCKTCSEYPYCGGGRPRCARRSERK